MPTPINRKRKYAGITVVLGSIFEIATNHSGIAETGHESPLKNSAIGDRNTINTIADSRCLNNVEIPIPREITAMA